MAIVDYTNVGSWRAVDEIERMLNKAYTLETPALMRMKLDDTGADWNGDYFETRLQTEQYMGGSMQRRTVNSSLPKPGTLYGKVLQFFPVRAMIPYELDRHWMDLTESTQVTADGVRAITEVSRHVMEARRRMSHEWMWHNGGCELARLDAVISKSGTTYTFTLDETDSYGSRIEDSKGFDDDEPTRWVKKGLHIQVYDQSATGTILGPDDGYIVNEVTGKKTFTATLYTSGQDDTGYAAAQGDVIVRYNSTNSTDGHLCKSAPWGIPAIVSQSDPQCAGADLTAGGTAIYYGQGSGTAANYQRASNAVMKAEIIHGASGDSKSELKRDWIRQGITQAEDNGGRITALYMCREVEAEWNQMAAAMLRYDLSQGSTRTIPNGVFNIRRAEFEGRQFDIIVDKDCTPFCIYGLSEQFFEHKLTPRRWHFMRGPIAGIGHYMAATYSSSSTDTVAFFYVGDPETVCKLPGGNFAIHNIDHIVSS